MLRSLFVTTGDAKEENDSGGPSAEGGEKQPVGSSQELDLEWHYIWTLFLKETKGWKHVIGTGVCSVLEYYVPKVLAELTSQEIGRLVQEAIKKDSPETGTSSVRCSRRNKGPAEPDCVEVVHETHGKVVVYLKKEGVEKMMEKETKPDGEYEEEYRTFYDNLE